MAAIAEPGLGLHLSLKFGLCHLVIRF
jgi:hypothetical protein